MLRIRAANGSKCAFSGMEENEWFLTQSGLLCCRNTDAHEKGYNTIAFHPNGCVSLLHVDPMDNVYPIEDIDIVFSLKGK